MTADLSRACSETGEVVAVERLGTLVEVTARLPVIAARALPGSFLQLRCAPGPVPLLRRPFSVAWTDGEHCSVVLEAVGAGTALLAALQPGDALDALGPLGHGFDIVASGPVVCVAGGVGCAPFPLLVHALRAAGVADITVLNGAATASRLYPGARYGRGAADVRVLEATDDGSAGHRGRVTELLRAVLGERAGAAVYACGPNLMLAAVAEILNGEPGFPAHAQASLEAPMGCGFGTCLGCVLPVRDGDGERWALCCSDGPVFDMREVAWRSLQRLPEPSVA